MLDTILLNAISWARQAGAIQLDLFRSGNLKIEKKINDSDIVTQADKLSEQLIINNIHTHYPTHSILSEESGEETQKDSEYKWIIDPLDGTTNFSSGLPLFSISIAVQKNNETIIGVVYAPYLNEVFHAVKGEGAFLNGNPISVSRNSNPAKAVLATGFPIDKNTNSDNNLNNVARIMPQIRGLRRLGSAAIDLCYVAAGFLDGYWELNLHKWDIAAGELIISEAGGMTTRFRPDRNYCIAASSAGIHQWLIKNLTQE